VSFSLTEPCLDLETLLIRYRALTGPSPKLRPERPDGADSDDDLLDDDVGMVNAKTSGIRYGGASVGTAKPAADDSDSDFDM
jgi:hypothetical protein